jgi:dTMP kinase
LPGVFVTFEGIDGSGKTTQAELLAKRLRREDGEVVLTREPGGTELGEAIRALVLHGGHVAPWAEAALYAAARAQHVDEVIRPALERGATVVSDRYLDSSVVYQGVGRGLGLERVLELNLTVVGGLLPDRTVLLRLEPGAASARLGGDLDRIEREGVTFLERVYEAYDSLADRYSDRYLVVDATRPPSELAEEIHGALRSSS